MTNKMLPVQQFSSDCACLDTQQSGHTVRGPERETPGRLFGMDRGGEGVTRCGEGEPRGRGNCYYFDNGKLVLTRIKKICLGFCKK